MRITKKTNQLSFSRVKRFSTVEHYITKGDRNGIRFGKIPKKHIEALDKLFIEDLPKWWQEQKSKLADKPEAGAGYLVQNLIIKRNGSKKFKNWKLSLLSF
jgi:hypothetical protein